ncbi:MAG: RNA-binding protein [Ignavibacteriales bacterium]|nr:RNA-binding protein [Ignavibacteriales bacterium]
MTIYIGNLSYEASEQDIQELFSKFGEVSSVKLIKDNTTGRSKGFGFVEMADASLSKRAIAELHETEFMSRNIVVNEARPKSSDDRSSFGGSRGGGNKSFGGGGYNRRNY